MEQTGAQTAIQTTCPEGHRTYGQHRPHQGIVAVGCQRCGTVLQRFSAAELEALPPAEQARLQRMPFIN